MRPIIEVRSTQNKQSLKQPSDCEEGGNQNQSQTLDFPGINQLPNYLKDLAPNNNNPLVNFYIKKTRQQNENCKPQQKSTFDHINFKMKCSLERKMPKGLLKKPRKNEFENVDFVTLRMKGIWGNKEIMKKNGDMAFIQSISSRRDFARFLYEQEQTIQALMLQGSGKMITINIMFKLDEKDLLKINYQKGLICQKIKKIVCKKKPILEQRSIFESIFNFRLRSHQDRQYLQVKVDNRKLQKIISSYTQSIFFIQPMKIEQINEVRLTALYFQSIGNKLIQRNEENIETFRKTNELLHCFGMVSLQISKVFIDRTQVINKKYLLKMVYRTIEKYILIESWKRFRPTYCYFFLIQGKVDLQYDWKKIVQATITIRKQ